MWLRKLTYSPLRKPTVTEDLRISILRTLNIVNIEHTECSKVLTAFPFIGRGNSSNNLESLLIQKAIPVRGYGGP
jgi:hypothetical protein